MLSILKEKRLKRRRGLITNEIITEYGYAESKTALWKKQWSKLLKLQIDECWSYFVKLFFFFYMKKICKNNIYIQNYIFLCQLFISMRRQSKRKKFLINFVSLWIKMNNESKNLNKLNSCILIYNIIYLVLLFMFIQKP